MPRAEHLTLCTEETLQLDLQHRLPGIWSAYLPEDTEEIVPFVPCCQHPDKLLPTLQLLHQSINAYQADATTYFRKQILYQTMLHSPQNTPSLEPERLHQLAQRAERIAQSFLKKK